MLATQRLPGPLCQSLVEINLQHLQCFVGQHAAELQAGPCAAQTPARRKWTCLVLGQLPGAGDAPHNTADMASELVVVRAGTQYTSCILVMVGHGTQIMEIIKAGYSNFQLYKQSVTDWIETSNTASNLGSREGIRLTCSAGCNMFCCIHYCKRMACVPSGRFCMHVSVRCCPSWQSPDPYTYTA